MSSPTQCRPDFIASNQIPVWVVITGNVRSGREFRRMFGQAVELRHKGLIDGIRFVTWQGELEQARGLETALTDSGISIITIEPPKSDPRVHPLFHGYVYHQRKSLHFALQSLPENCYVLKARTDFAEERFESMVATLFAAPDTCLRVTLPFPVISTRLFSYDARSDYLFYWDDIVFCGMRNDLLKFNNFDLSCEFIYPGHNPCAETRLFSQLFLNSYPIIRWFFENIHGERFARLLQVWLTSSESVPMPALVRDILASYLHILSRYVILPKSDHSLIFPISLRTYFLPNDGIGLKEFAHPWRSHKLVNQCLLDRLRTDEDFSDPNLASVVATIRKMDHDVDARGAITPGFEAELDEFRNFSARFDICPFVSQAQLIPATEKGSCNPGQFLEHVELPEKRHLSRWQQRKQGARKRAAHWLLGKFL